MTTEIAPRNTVLQGHCLDLLRTLPSESVHCVITSPPYYGLRSYATTPVVWDGDTACAHAWGDTQRAPWASELPGPQGRKKNTRGSRSRSADAGAFCQRCAAWRGELGAEPSVAQYVAHLVTIFAEVWRVLRPDGTVWLNLGDSYAGRGCGGVDSSLHANMNAKWNHVSGPISGRRATATKGGASLKNKDLCLIPARVAIALQEWGWYVRAEVIWAKIATMPESVGDRPTHAHEQVYLLAKSGRPQFWTHRDGGRATRGTRPTPDYRWVREVADEVCDEETSEHSNEETTIPQTGVGWKRINLWRAHDYYYDALAIAEPAVTGAKGSMFTKGKTAEAHPAPSVRPRKDYATRNARDVWAINPEPFSALALGLGDIDHFAVMPTALAERCLLAGTPPRACETCGAPWRRIIEDRAVSGGRSGRAARIPEEVEEVEEANADDRWANQQYGRTLTHGLVIERTTVGWGPTCACELNTGAARSLALDLFMGAGTTSVACRRHSRDYLGLELNPQYITLAEARNARERQPHLWTA